MKYIDEGTDYLAGAMYGQPNNGYDLFDAGKRVLLDNGRTPVSPADMDREDGDTEEVVPYSVPWRGRLRKDVAVIAKVERMTFLPTWKVSLGSKLERRVGYELGIPFWRVDPSTNAYYPEKVVGLAGYAMVGKDTAAEALRDSAGWTLRGFATAIKEVLHATNPLVAENEDPWIEIRVQELVGDVGWTEAKKEPEVRQLLQRLGTEAGRDIFGDDFWIKTLFQTCLDDKIVVPDVRYPNEAQAISDRGGVIIRIERDGYGPVNDHISEIGFDDYDFKYVINNDGTPESLGRKVLEIVGDHYK